MNERDAFLDAIAANPDDDLIRLVYADWLDEHGEPEEAERQRQWPEAKKRLDEICAKHNATCLDYHKFTRDDLLEFGRSASAIPDVQIEMSRIPVNYDVVTAIRDQIPEFWKAWSVITGSPLKPDVAKKYYFISGYCCATEVYDDTHLAGPIPEEMIRAHEERERLRLEHQEELQLQEELSQQRLEEEENERRQQVYDRVQDDLEQDRP